MRPEELAREKIDALLAKCGWVVQNYAKINIWAADGVAVREYPLMSGHGSADCLLYANGEAKPEGCTLTGVGIHHLPLSLHYESTGVSTQLTNRFEPEARSREVFAFHRPAELIRQAGLGRQLRPGPQQLPDLAAEGSWPAQVEAITSPEQSLANSRPRAVWRDRERAA